ncbi:MAG: hypothetical protein M1820_006227 [Bogoriella megaspora]|nr:MAG: hypothetical protein M1820_006227 [Bogoriella megaspora]
MFKRFWKSPVQYRALGDIYADEKPNSTAIDSSTPELALPYRPTFWMVLASILAFTCAVLSTALVYTVQTKSQWRAIDSRLTDFEPALAVDEPVRVRFSGTATFDEHGTAHRDFDSSVVQYVGSPSPQIDQAWEGLIAGRYFSITDDEAQQAWGDSYHQYHKAPVAGYMAGHLTEID